jgi:septin 7
MPLVESPKSPPPPVPVVSSTNPKVAAQAAVAADAKNIVRRKLTGYVGFANLPNQWHRKSVRKGFNFNVMVVGTLRSRRIKKHRTRFDGIML